MKWCSCLVVVTDSLKKLSGDAETCLCRAEVVQNICIIHSVSNMLMSYEYGKNVILE